MAQWYEKAAGQARLAMEDMAMRRFHPGFALRRRGDGTLYYQGRLSTTIDEETYTVQVVFSARHPNVAPAVYVRQPDLRRKGSPHMYTDGRLCLYRPGDGKGEGYAADATTAATMVGWAAAWLHAYEIWKRSGSWPGPDGHH